MADHTINVKLNSTGISKLVRAVADLRKSIDNLTSAFDPLLSKLDSVAKKFQDIANVVRDIKGVRATSNRGSSSNAGGNNSQSNKSSMQDRVEANVGIMSNRNKVYEERFRKAEERKAKEDKRKADREAAAAKKAQEVADRAEHNKKNPHQHLFQGAFGYRRQSILDTLQGKFNKMPAGKQESIAQLVGMFKVLRGFVLLSAVVIGVVAAIHQFASAMQQATQKLNLQGAQSNNDPSNYGRGKALGNALGTDVIADAANFNGGTKVFWQMLDTLRNIEDDYTANEFAKSVGLQNYLGVRRSQMSEGQYQGIRNAKEESPMKGNFAQGTKSWIDGIMDDFRYMGDQAKALGAFIAGIVSFFPAMMAKFFRWAKTFTDGIRNKIFGGADSKLNKAATNLDKSAILLLKAAGAYGGGDRFRQAVPANMFTPGMAGDRIGYQKLMSALNWV